MFFLKKKKSIFIRETHIKLELLLVIFSFNLVSHAFFFLFVHIFKKYMFFLYKYVQIVTN